MCIDVIIIVLVVVLALVEAGVKICSMEINTEKLIQVAPKFPRRKCVLSLGDLYANAELKKL